MLTIIHKMSKVIINLNNIKISDLFVPLSLGFSANARFYSLLSCSDNNVVCSGKYRGCAMEIYIKIRQGVSSKSAKNM